MPTYDYRCPANGQVVEVKHSIHDVIRTWGELCSAVGRDLATTPADAPVEKVLSASFVKSNSLGSEPPCKTGPCCGGGGCGHSH
jgi:hypothetical protein